MRFAPCRVRNRRRLRLDFSPLSVALLCLGLLLIPAGAAWADNQAPSQLAPAATSQPAAPNADGSEPGSAASQGRSEGGSSEGGQPVPAQEAPVPDRTYSKNDIIIAANNFFGGVTQGLAQAVEKVFSKMGEPNAYIVGNEGGGAFIVGLRYGIGTLQYKGGKPMRVYWQGPSAGFDFGGNASKTFMLVYGLHWTNQLFQRFPGVAGSLYVVAGVGLNYLHADGITIAPIRTGVGLRAGANVGYLSFAKKRTWNPF